MSTGEKIRAYFNRIREKHKLTFVDDSDYQEKWSYRVSTLNLLSLLGLYTTLIITIVFLLIIFTPISNFFGQPMDITTGSQMEEMSHRLDSLQQITDSRQKYLDDLKKILNAESFNDSTSAAQNEILTENYRPDFSKSAEDSLLRNKVESEGKDIVPNRNSEYAFFFSPVTGVVSQSFNPSKNHFGVDVVTEKDDPIKSCLDGTVIMTGWQASEGNIVIIQHANELISIYKHCSVIMKVQGEKVQSGDPVAIVGNTGENSSGPHLHFELWIKGSPVNPEDYVSF